MKYLALLLLCTLPLSASKKTEWRDAKLISISTYQFDMPDGSVVRKASYIFDDGTLMFAALSHNGATLNVEVFKSFKIAVEKRNLRVIDSGGKEVKIPIVEMKVSPH